MAPGAVQILIIILIVMVLFGAGRIPNIMENLAKGINSFKKGLKDDDDGKDSKTPTPTPTASIEDKRKSSKKSAVEEKRDKTKDL